MKLSDQIKNNPPSTVLWKGAVKLTPVDWCVPGLILAFAGTIIFFSFQIRLAPETLVGDSMQPRTFPIFLMILIILLTIVLVLDMIRIGPDKRESLLWQTWVSMALFGVFAAVTMTMDMILALAIVLFCFSLTFGQQRFWIAATVAIATPLIVFFAFDLGLGIRFPRGILTELYY